MGAARRRKQEFFQKHPLCCYCGGKRAASEEDHQPARVFFRDRKWPEGFVFPACHACNSASREAEHLVSLFVSHGADEAARTAYRKRIASIRANYPGVVDSLFEISTRQKRKALKNLGVKPPIGATIADLPIVSMEPNIWRPHLEMVGRKIMLSLHYQTFGIPLSAAGRVWLSIQTNASDLSRDWIQTAFDLTGRYVMPTRCNEPLVDQLRIQWDFISEPRVGLYVVVLQRMLILIGLTTERPDIHDFPTKSPLLTPFD